jgi:hypothetical protein
VETGNRAIPSLAKALEANQRDVAKQLALVGDTFEAAIAFSKNQSDCGIYRIGDRLWNAWEDFGIAELR